MRLQFEVELLFSIKKVLFNIKLFNYENLTLFIGWISRIGIHTYSSPWKPIPENEVRNTYKKQLFQ